MPLIYNGTTITAVTYNGVALSTLIYNGTVVWTAGYIQGMYYGGRYGDYTYYNTVTRINSSGALVGSETAVGTAREYVGGASTN